MTSSGPGRVLRIEVITAIGCTAIGGLFELRGSLLRGMAIFLFAWSFGCAFHLATIPLARHRIGRHRR